MKLIIDNNNEIVFKTTKSIEEIKTYIEEIGNKDIIKLIDMFEGVSEIDPYNAFSVDIYENEISIYGDDGIITLEILELNKINNI
tara:strand:+ start:321 stop:575 length:255 start_codon:yes stop_codon:yes gene_type:complete